MKNFLEELASTLGYGSVSVFIVIVLFKFVIKPAYDSFLQNKVDLATIAEQSKFKIEEMREQNKLENEGKLYSSKLELDSFKMNKVLPALEEINSLIMEHRVLYNSYNNSIVNKGGFTKERETRRVEIDEKMLELKNKIGIYLPNEFRTLLNRMRVIMSVSWNEPIILNNIFHSLGIKPVFIVEKVNEIYDDYVECFFEMVSEYIIVSSNNKNYSNILIKNNLTISGEHSACDPLYRVAKAYVLYHEYTDLNEYSSIDEILASMK